MIIDLSVLPAPGTPGAPNYWQQETSGVLAPAIERLIKRPVELTVRDISLIRSYFMQWIEASAWDLNPTMNSKGRAELRALRIAAREITTVADISNWLDKAGPGYDPL